MISLRVKEVAAAKNISMTRLSRIADVEYKTVRKIFQNPEAEIGITTLDKLCWALRVTPAELIEYRRTPPESLRDMYSENDSKQDEK